MESTISTSTDNLIPLDEPTGMNHNMNYGSPSGLHPQQGGGQGFYGGNGGIDGGSQFQYSQMAASPYGPGVGNNPFQGGAGSGAGPNGGPPGVPSPGAPLNYGNQNSPFSPSGCGGPEHSQGYPTSPYYSSAGPSGMCSTTTGYYSSPNQRNMHHGSSSFSSHVPFGPGLHGSHDGGEGPICGDGLMRPPQTSPHMMGRPMGMGGGPSDLNNKFQPDSFSPRGFPGNFNNGFSDGTIHGVFSPGGTPHTPQPAGSELRAPMGPGSSPHSCGSPRVPKKEEMTSDYDSNGPHRTMTSESGRDSRPVSPPSSSRNNIPSSISHPVKSENPGEHSALASQVADQQQDLKPGDSISSSHASSSPHSAVGNVNPGDSGRTKLSERYGSTGSMAGSRTIQSENPQPSEPLPHTLCASNSSPFEGGKNNFNKNRHPSTSDGNNDHHSFMDNLEAISELPDIPELKFNENSQSGSNSSGDVLNTGGQRSGPPGTGLPTNHHNPQHAGPPHPHHHQPPHHHPHSMGNQEDEGHTPPSSSSSSSYIGQNHQVMGNNGGGSMFENYNMGQQPQQHMSDGPMQTPLSMYMGYPGQQMWDYNYQHGYPQQGCVVSSGNGASGHSDGIGYPQGLSNVGIDGGGIPPHSNWWANSGPGMPRTPSPSEISTGNGGGFRMPGAGGPLPGPWAMRGMRNRPDSRRGGMTRPRLGTPGSPGSAASDLSGPYIPGSPFPGSPDMGNMDLRPGSPIPKSRKRPGPGRPRGGISPSVVSNLLDPNNPIVSPLEGPEPKASKSSTNANKKKYTCEICQKRFSTAWYVRVHRRSHNGERPYSCHNCGKGFMLPNVLQVHLRKCEKNNAPQPGAGMSGIPPDLASPRMPPTDVSAPSLHPQSPPQSSPSLLNPGPLMSQPFDDSSRMQSQHPLPQGPGGPYGGMLVAGGGPPHTSYNQRFMGYPPPHMGEMSGPPFNPGHDPSQQGSFDMTPPQSHPGSIGGGSSSPNQQGQYPPGLYSPGLGRPPPSMSSSGDTIPSSSSPTSSHFLANDRPPDKGGGEEKACPPGVNPDLYCNLCEVQFDDKTGLEEHLKSHRPYSCEVCEKRFSQKCNLITHIRLHTGEKPYLCSFCDKRFTQKGNLDAHVKTHTKEKPYPCSQCGKKFAFKSSMLAHVKQTHGNLGLEWDEDDICSIKQHLKFNNSTPEYIPATSLTPPVTSPHNYSSGIPTPQSSLDSIPGSVPQPGINPYHNQHQFMSSSALDTPSTPQSSLANGESDSNDPSGFHMHLPPQPVLLSSDPPPDMTNHISKLASLAASTGVGAGGPLNHGNAPSHPSSKPTQNVGVN